MLVYFFVHVATTTKNDTYLHPPSLHVDLSIVIAYLKEATADDSGGQTKQGGMRRGPTLQDLKAVGPDRQVTTVRYCGDTYHVTTAAGETIPFRSEEHTSELQSPMRNTYDGFRLKKKQQTPLHTQTNTYT